MEQNIETKACTGCGEDKPLSGFYPKQAKVEPVLYRARCKTCDSARAKVWVVNNREKDRAQSKKWRTENPRQFLSSKLLHHYGITLDDYEKMLAAQGGACAICRGEPQNGRTRLDVDHNEETGRVRGLLCGPCNRMIAQGRHNPTTLRAGADYMERTECAEPGRG